MYNYKIPHDMTKLPDFRFDNLVKVAQSRAKLTKSGLRQILNPINGKYTTFERALILGRLAGLCDRDIVLVWLRNQIPDDYKAMRKWIILDDPNSLEEYKALENPNIPDEARKQAEAGYLQDVVVGEECVRTPEKKYSGW